jgi:hypothetical protein
MTTVVSSAFTADPPEADGRRNLHEVYTTDDGQVFTYDWLADSTIDPQTMLAERTVVINARLALRDAARAAADGTLVPMTRFEFLSRFTVQERIAVRALAVTDPIVADFMDLLSQSGNVTHVNARAGLAYLVQVGALVQDRADIIGAP